MCIRDRLEAAATATPVAKPAAAVPAHEEPIRYGRFTRIWVNHTRLVMLLTFLAILVVAYAGVRLKPFGEPVNTGWTNRAHRTIQQIDAWNYLPKGQWRSGPWAIGEVSGGDLGSGESGSGSGRRLSAAPPLTSPMAQGPLRHWPFGR